MIGCSFRRAFALGVAIALSPLHGDASGQDREPDVLRAGDLELLQAVRAVAARVEAVRGEKLGSVPLAIRAGADEPRAPWVAIDRTPSAVRVLEARGRAWRDIGLGDENTPGDLARHIEQDLEGMAIDPGARRLWVAADRLTDADFGPTEGDSDAASLLLITGVRPDEPLAAHYVSHAFDRFPERHLPDQTTTDAMLAGAAWAEGAANLVALTLLFDGLGLSSDVLGGRISPGKVLDGELFPASFRASDPVVASFLFFVYEEGFAQAAEAVRLGGWEALRSAARTRRTTFGVLHPERAPGGSSRAPDPALRLPSDYRVVDRDVVGAQGIATLISTRTGKDNLGLLAADGWAGDALIRYEPDDPDGPEQGITVWSTLWASERHASDFEYGLLRVLGARTGAETIPPGAGGVAVVEIGNRTSRLRRSGSSVSLTVAPTALGVVPADFDPAAAPEKGR